MRIIHGHTWRGGCTKTYAAWSEMRTRCRHRKHHQWDNYGGRGITVCPEWERFEQFLKDTGEAPTGKTLERKDNEKGYSKDNCTWVTKLEQGRNRRTNRKLRYHGETLCMSEWSARLGASENTIRERLHRGWSIKEAVTTPV